MRGAILGDPEIAKSQISVQENNQGWPEPYINGVYTVFLAGKSPNLPYSYTVSINGSGHPRNKNIWDTFPVDLLKRVRTMTEICSYQTKRFYQFSTQCLTVEGRGGRAAKEKWRTGQGADSSTMPWQQARLHSIWANKCVGMAIGTCVEDWALNTTSCVGLARIIHE